MSRHASVEAGQTTGFHLGQRLSYEGELCTVQYIGNLDGLKGDWLGIEWDDPQRGKHDGRHQGKIVFKCLSSSPTAASFVRPTRKTDKQRTVLEAIRLKYSPARSSDTLDSNPRDTLNGDIIEISGKVAEEVGFDRIRQQQAALENLKVVILDHMNVIGISLAGGSDEEVIKAQDKLERACPSVTELDLGWNPVETWKAVADICVPLPRLKVVRASGLRLRDAGFSTTRLSMIVFSHLQELYLDHCLITGDQIDQLLSTSLPHLSFLSSLSLSSNWLSTFPDVRGRYPKLKTLYLENNVFKDFYMLLPILQSFPNLKTLSLQGNSIRAHHLSEHDVKRLSSNRCETLDISRNDLTSYDMIDDLPTLFPLMSSLRTSNNPFTSTLQSHSTGAQDGVFFLTLARIPNLETLNYTTITARDREEGEIYYLVSAEKAWRSGQSTPASLNYQRASFAQEFRRYEDLCIKYDRESIFAEHISQESKLQQSDKERTYPPGSLGARLINTTFYLPSNTTPNRQQPDQHRSQTRLIPRATDVYTLKSLVTSHFFLPPLQFRLIYESPELDPVREQIGNPHDWDRWGDWDVDDLGDGLVDASTGSNDVNGEWMDGVLFKEGRRWRKRETEILNGWREWSYYLENDVKEATVRIELFDVKIADG